MGDEMTLADEHGEMFVYLSDGFVAFRVESSSGAASYIARDGDTLLLLAYILEHKTNLFKALPQRLQNLVNSAQDRK